MAGKQLGKLRQWAGEVISVRDKTIVPEEFKELEHDIELRRQGLWKLHVASADFCQRLSKKKPCEAIGDNEKLLPVDALGVVMIQHGEEFGDDSAFGTSLVALGRAHCKVATLQEAFALHFEETYVAALQRAEDEIKEYQSQRKKMESRRLAFDAAIAKVERVRGNKKEKEKERKDAEDEHARAKSRYEEITEDVRARMLTIQEEELDLLKELTSFLNTEMKYVEQYLDVLKEAKKDWLDDATLAQMERSRGPRSSPTAISRTVSAEDAAMTPKFGSLRSSKPGSRAQSVGDSDESDGDDDANDRPGKLSKSSSLRKASKTGSRPQSRTDRSRADSTATSASNVTAKDKDKDKGGEKPDAKKMGIAGWASSISKMTGRAKKGRADALMGGESDGESDPDEAPVRTPAPASATASPRATPIKPKLSRGNTPNASPSLPSRTLKAQAKEKDKEKKVAVALHDFAAGSSDELSFKAGDQIVVLSEVVDGWWMGELSGTGKTGLFPTTYTEVLGGGAGASKPLLPRRPSGTVEASANVLGPSIGRRPQEKEGVKKPAWLTQDLSDEDDHPFGDNYVAAGRTPGATTLTMQGGFYSESVASSAGGDDDDDEARLVPSHPSNSNSNPDDGLHVLRGPPPPVPTRRPSNPSSKKAPPPPPPPRRATSNTLGHAPSKTRSNSSSRTNSTNTSYASIPDPAPAPAGQDELTASPFGNAACAEFKQNPFKSKGMCNNCFEMHG